MRLVHSDPNLAIIAVISLVSQLSLMQSLDIGFMHLYSLYGCVIT